MKKLTVLALLAIVVMAAPAFAVQRGRVTEPNATFLFGSPTTTNNNDSCDIGVTPAATLLLPYFEVDTAAAAGTGATTLFTITNTSRFPQIAHVTLWTAWSTPVLDFNLYLTGYDVQPINLYDIIVRGIIAPPSGAVFTTTPGTQGPNVVGAAPLAGGAANNPNFTANAATTCSNIPGTLPGGQGGAIQLAVQAALTTGTSTAVCTSGSGLVGPNNGTRAIGYVTVDVAAECTNYLPTDPLYYTSTNGILFDNVLIGDYQQLAPSPAGSTGTGFDAAGNPMVHIRAIPEGGIGGSAPGTNLPFTFYNRYSNAATAGNPGLDRRQPLPSQWAARWVGGTVAGATFNTDFKIWREGITGANACPGSTNSLLSVTNTIRFDEHENSLGFGTNVICSPFCGAAGIPGLPEASRVAVGTATNSGISGTFPSVPATGLTSGDVGGWVYLNLSSGATNTNGVTAGTGVLTASRVGFGGLGGVGTPRRTTQNWVVVSMFGNVGTQRLAADFDAAWLGNGCSAAPAAGAVIGPAATFNGSNTVIICPVGGTCATGTANAPVGPTNPTP
jgi:hypothetical protein